mmetsp:Transcript_55758/g.50171  ORF Transcript_55758/g.50171 Transcript_55758/m.50171 type:complete len:330 (+) Transcript_55758:272-1261(+)
MAMNNKSKLSFDLKLNLNAPLIVNNSSSTTNKPSSYQVVSNNNNNLYHQQSPISMSKIQQQQYQQPPSFNPKSPTPSSPVTPCHPPMIIDNDNDDKPVYNLVVLDWDDTLFPTTSIVLDKRQLSAIELLYFGKYLYELIDELIKSYGDSNIYIITNAAKEWVFRSLKESSQRYQRLTSHDQYAQSMNYFAAIYNSLLTLNITVISAQDRFSGKYPGQPLIWKLNAFKQITVQHFMSLNKINKYETCQYIILSIGDSEDEFTASLEAKYCLKRQIEQNPYNESEILLHRIKLMEDPSPQQMMQQMIMLKSNVKAIKSVISGKDNAITLRL